MKWNDDNTITIDPPARTKKITGTRFAAVLGLNEWTTPFKTWCAVTKTYEEPFTDTIYTVAGKTIEPKQAEYVKDFYFWKQVVSPTDKYGSDYFEKTWGDFFPENPILGGMWDYLLVNDKGQIEGVFEMKTTKRAEDWLTGIPEYYALQAALYAYLLGVDDVYMVCTVLDEKDYQNPEAFEVTSDNTFVRPFKMSERYPQFEKIVQMVYEWWDDHVKTGVSPEYSEEADADILKVLRANTLNPDTNITELLNEADELQIIVDKATAETAELEKRLKILKDLIKEYAQKNFREGDKNVIMGSQHFDWVTSKTVSKKIDEDAMKADGILDKYKTKETTTYRLTAKTKGDK